MICANCGGSTEESARSCASCGQAVLLEGRYRLEAIIGKGAAGTTYRATRVEDGVQVAIKELLLRSIDSFETETLFQREAEVLRTLHHPGVPRYYEHMSAGSGKQMGFYLVQEFVAGTNLAVDLAERRFTEIQILEMLREICEILSYLHGFRPPVIHRDIKPANIMRRHSDGRLVLIDFGSVRAAVVDPQLGGNTVAGTFGFMAPEQFAGQATPASDLYGLGATALALLSRQEPQVFMDHDHRLIWQEAVHASAGLKSVLADLLQRDPGRRPQDAAVVAARLAAVATSGVDPEARSVAPMPAVAAERQVALWAEPPFAPREPPSLTMRAVDPGASFNLLFGSIFGGVGGTLGIVFTGVAIGTGDWIFGLVGPLIGLIFGGIGGTFLVLGIKRVKRLRAIYRHGEVAQGRVHDVARDWTIRVNGRSPLRITYLFEVQGRRLQGTGHSWDEWHMDAARDTPVAVLYDRDDPTRNMLYLNP